MLPTRVGCILLFAAILVFCQPNCCRAQYINIVNTTIDFNAKTSDCSSNCTTSIPVDGYDCNYQSSTWGTGMVHFQDPVPSGYIVKGINVTLLITAGCTNNTKDSGLVTVDGTVLNFVPPFEGSLLNMFYFFMQILRFTRFFILFCFFY